MPLLEFCKSYIVHKFDTHINAYADLDKKLSCRNLLKYSKSFSELENSLKLCCIYKFYSLSNYYVIVRFCRYITAMEYPCQNTIIDRDIVSDFLFIDTSGKKLSTKINYSRFILNFSQQFNSSVHRQKNELNIRMQKNYDANFMSFQKVLTRDEVYSLLQYLDERALSSINSLIKLILYTGIRTSEAINIKKKNMFARGDMYILQVCGKGRKFRIVSIKKHHLFEYYKKFVLELKSDDYIFYRKRNQIFHRQNIYDELKKIFNLLKISKMQNGAHLLRHTFATFYYIKYKDILMLQECLGHENISTTRKYLHLHQSDIKRMTEVYDFPVKEDDELEYEEEKEEEHAEL